MTSPGHRAPMSIQMPASNMTGWQESVSAATTPRANGNSFPLMTPGMGIAVMTPPPNSHLPGVPEDGAPLTKRISSNSQTRSTGERSLDYFSNTSAPSESNGRPPTTPGAIQDDRVPKLPIDAEKATNGKESGTLFGKKFRMGMSFSSKKLGRSASVTAEKPVVADENSEDSPSDSESKEKEVDDNLYGVIQKIRHEYGKSVLADPSRTLESGITPSLPSETPVLKPSPLITVIIQEETSGGSADLYRGTVGTVGQDARLIEQHAPMWLGELLLRVC